MWSVPTVVIGEYVNDPLKVLLVQDQQLVETFRADRAHEPLRNPVGLWRAKRRSNDLDAVGSKYLVKTVRELLITITNQKPDRFRTIRQDP